MLITPSVGDDDDDDYEDDDGDYCDFDDDNDEGPSAGPASQRTTLAHQALPSDDIENDPRDGDYDQNNDDGDDGGDDGGDGDVFYSKNSAVA